MTLQEIINEAKQDNKDDIRKFMRDMKNAGLKLQYYGGRNFWQGPAVVVENIQDALSNTKVPCQWDNMGRDYVVYPKQSLKHKRDR